MTTQPRRRYTLEEYFALELASEEKYEYFDGEVFKRAQVLGALEMYKEWLLAESAIAA
ncbi:MAG: hypothetical protein QOF61_1928 [Acidobacteriota bacterium]|jgi:Uma2 family endonuclease|nr:hypothetical protein [Acidobacteriota bacterium]